MPVSRLFTRNDIKVEDMFHWTRRKLEIKEGDRVVFSGDVEAPDFWSDLAVTVAAKTWFRTIKGVRETSIRSMISRVVDAIAAASEFPDVGFDYFAGDAQRRKVFRDELFFICAAQYALFNTPVWVNVGVSTSKHTVPRVLAFPSKRGGVNGAYRYRAPNVGPQASACFIQGVTDTMEGLCELQTTETQLFRRSSGTGSNMSPLRPANSPLSGGGSASGPVSFMKGLDAWAGVTKSGGSSRRAALMRVLDIYHPDVHEFINVKSQAQKMIRDLGLQGWDVNYNGVATTWTPYQNANDSVRVDDAFMTAATTGGSFTPHWPTQWIGATSEAAVVKTPVPAAAILREIAKAAHDCGDPGMQYHTQINAWHTCKQTDQIYGSNPCQPGEATVLTPEGIRTFNDIDVGSVIWSGKQWTQVTRKLATGKKQVNRYVTAAGSFVGTKDHRVLCEGEKIAIEEAVSVDVCRGAIPSSTPVDPQDVLDGLVMGDGTRHKNGSKQHVLLCIGKDDTSYFDSEVKHLVGNYYGKLAYRVQTTLTFEEVPKIPGRKVPERFHKGSFEKMRGFLRGMFSANGTVGLNLIALNTTSPDLAHQVQEMLSAIGIRSYIAKTAAGTKKFPKGFCDCHGQHFVRITSKQDLRNFAKLVGFIQPYKTDKLQSLLQTPGLPTRKNSYEINEIIDLGVTDVYDITVDADEHTYWTGGLLVSNCSEYMFLNDSACNLASLRLTKFLKTRSRLVAQSQPLGMATGQTYTVFDLTEFKHVARLMFIAQEVLIGAASYPTEKIAQNSHDFRPLGLGYCDLGALLMQQGVAYDSDMGRDVCGAVTALLGGVAYSTSAELARQCGGPFQGYLLNVDAMINVIKMHSDEATKAMNSDIAPVAFKGIRSEAVEAWRQALTEGTAWGFRNSQATVLAPTGSIGLAMDCDTTGIEPDTALVKYKRLAGGGTVEIVNGSVEKALQSLGYDETTVQSVVTHVKAFGYLPDALVKPQDRAVFATAFGQPGNEISVEGHLKMMAAAQPFLSGAISKTVNLPKQATVEDIEGVFVQAWKLGLKAVAVYRDGCKDQPLQAKGTPVEAVAQPTPITVTPTAAEAATAQRRRLPQERPGLTRKFTIGGVDGYIHLGLYPDGGVGEIFIDMEPKAKAYGLDLIMQAASVALQRGEPLDRFVERWLGTEFEPRGFTGEGADGIPYATSPLDYLAKWLQRRDVGEPVDEAVAAAAAEVVAAAAPALAQMLSSATKCPRCAATMRRDGACLQCPTCGYGQGGCGG